MAKTETGHAFFTKDMRKDYTILIPMMAPIHFTLIKNVFQHSHYNVELLENCSPSVVEEGLKYVHNDTCYPALLVIGQMIDALNSGKYDVHKTALIITQTGGGCRASNYIFLLRKALKKAGYEFVPVISLNILGMEKNSGFTLTLKMLHKMVAALVYGDLLMDLANQCRPYETETGITNSLTDQWITQLSSQFATNRGYSMREMKRNMQKIVSDYEKLGRIERNCVKVGIVGEIYIKYSSLGNNNLESFLHAEGAEIKVPGILGFALYCIYNQLEDFHLYSGSKTLFITMKTALWYLTRLERLMLDALADSKFHAPLPFNTMKELAKKVIGLGTKMGEGWLLTGEMMELIQEGFKNIVCTQPFGCLPNHIVGKGMIRKIKEIDPESNIVAIDYDPSTTEVNQENRIKLMLSIAKEAL